MAYRAGMGTEQREESWLQRLDRDRARLQRDHPGWNIWYVPSTTRGITWFAQPKPRLNCDSPDHLGKAIQEAETELRASLS